MKKAQTGSLVVLLCLTAVPVGAQSHSGNGDIDAGRRAIVATPPRDQVKSRNDSGAEQTERTTSTFRLGADGALSLENVAGGIVVTRGTGADTTVDILKTAHGRDMADARQLLQLVTVEAVERSGRGEVKTRYPNSDEARRKSRRTINVSVGYTISTPAATRITIKSISGDVQINDIKGDLVINTISGDVKIAGGGRISSAKTISGTVQIADSQLDGTLETSSVSGDVTLRRITARRISAGSVSGAARLEDVASDRIEAYSTTSSIWFSGQLIKNGRYQLKGFSGDIHVQLSGNTGFEVDATTVSGEISHAGIAISARTSTDRRTLDGTYGDGSAVLELRTFNGSIFITKK